MQVIFCEFVDPTGDEVIAPAMAMPARPEPGDLIALRCGLFRIDADKAPIWRQQKLADDRPHWILSLRVSPVDSAMPKPRR